MCASRSRSGSGSWRTTGLQASFSSLVARRLARRVQLVAMSIDYKARVIRAVNGSGVRGARVLCLFMAFLTCIVRISLICLMGTELVYVVTQTASMNRVVIVIYIISSLASAGKSFLFVPGHESDPLAEDDSEDDSAANFPSIVRPLFAPL
jgi:hypothetical protein